MHKNNTNVGSRANPRLFQPADDSQQEGNSLFLFSTWPPSPSNRHQRRIARSAWKTHGYHQQFTQHLAFCQAQQTQPCDKVNEAAIYKAPKRPILEYETCMRPLHCRLQLPFRRSTGVQQRWARQDYKATLSVTAMPEGLDWP